ncbi:MAG: AsmA family protein, partial [Acidiferrobacterales bacterium]
MKAKPKSKARVRKIVGWSAIVLATVIAVALVILLLVDVAVYRGPLQSGVSALLGRSVRFEGAMSLSPSLWPRIVIEDVRVANPEWASRPDFARADRLEFKVVLLPLIRGELKILGLELEGSDILLETRPDGRNNWTFREKRDKPIVLPDIESLTWRRSVVGFRSGGDRVYRLAISEANAVLREGERIQFQAGGTYQDVPFTLSLLGGTPYEFAAFNIPWPIKLTAQAAGAAVEVEGTITRPFEGEGFDLQIAVRGEQTKDLSSLLDVALPALGPYALSGRVTGADNRYSITDVTGHLAGAEAVRRLALTQGTASAPVDTAMELRLEGAYADVPFTVSLMGGSLAELIAPTKPWPVELRAHAASLSLDIVGTVAKPLVWDEFDIKLAASGKEIGDLNPLIDAELPALGPYAVSARVTAADKDYTITDLAGHLGKGKAKNHLAIKKGEVSAPDGKPLKLKVQGRYGDVPFGLSLAGGTLAELITPSRPWPIKLKANAVATIIDVSGTVAWPVEGKELDLGVKVRGKQLSALEPLLGIAVPAFGPYQLSGRVTDEDDGYSVTDLKAAIAGTDVAGMLALNRKGTRPHMSAKLASKTLNLEKLMPAGAPMSTENRKPVSLDLPLPVDMLRAIDADLDLAVKRLV